MELVRGLGGDQGATGTLLVAVWSVVMPNSQPGSIERESSGMSMCVPM